jgi:ribosomal-protein-alanine N-acetyltransferase
MFEPVSEQLARQLQAARPAPRVRLSRGKVFSKLSVAPKPQFIPRFANRTPVPSSAQWICRRNRRVVRTRLSAVWNTGIPVSAKNLSGLGRRPWFIIPRIATDYRGDHASIMRVLETPRLFLRPLELADAAQAQVLFAHWEIVRYLRKIVPWPYPPDGAYTWYREFALPAIERGEEWHWTLRLKESPACLIGAISLMREENDNRGFWLGLPWQGQGLMTEACEAVTDYWFDVLKFPVLRVPKAVPNVSTWSSCSARKIPNLPPHESTQLISNAPGFSRPANAPRLQTKSHRFSHLRTLLPLHKTAFNVFNHLRTLLPLSTCATVFVSCPCALLYKKHGGGGYTSSLFSGFALKMSYADGRIGRASGMLRPTEVSS